MRTPLFSVLSFLDLVLQTDLTAEQRDFLQSAQESGNVLSSILDSVLGLAKSEQSSTSTSIEPQEDGDKSGVMCRNSCHELFLDSLRHKELARVSSPIDLNKARSIALVHVWGSGGMIIQNAIFFANSRWSMFFLLSVAIAVMFVVGLVAKYRIRNIKTYVSFLTNIGIALAFATCSAAAFLNTGFGYKTQVIKLCSSAQQTYFHCSQPHQPLLPSFRTQPGLYILVHRGHHNATLFHLLGRPLLVHHADCRGNALTQEGEKSLRWGHLFFLHALCNTLFDALPFLEGDLSLLPPYQRDLCGMQATSTLSVAARYE